jgi:hypothetical protein
MIIIMMIDYFTILIVYLNVLVFRMQILFVYKLIWLKY